MFYTLERPLICIDSSRYLTDDLKGTYSALACGQ